MTAPVFGSYLVSFCAPDQMLPSASNVPRPRWPADRQRNLPQFVRLRVEPDDIAAAAAEVAAIGADEVAVGVVDRLQLPGLDRHAGFENARQVVLPDLAGVGSPDGLAVGMERHVPVLGEIGHHTLHLTGLGVDADDAPMPGARAVDVAGVLVDEEPVHPRVDTGRVGEVVDGGLDEARRLHRLRQAVIRHLAGLGIQHPTNGLLLTLNQTLPCASPATS